MHSTRTYLGVGINRTDDSTIAPLNKCVADVEYAAAYFDSIGFDAAVLADAQATKSAIATAIDVAAWRDKQSADPTIFVYHHSSHGLQVRDVSGDEHDALDEAVCTCETYWDAKAGDWQNVITDDEFNALFSSFKPSSLVLAVFDTCHSGSISRAVIANRRYAYRRDNRDLPWLLLKRARLSDRRGFIACNDQPFVVLAGSSENGFSYEDSSGGLLTNAFIKILRAAQPDKPPVRKCLIKQIIRDIASRGFDQQPHYECSLANFKKRELSL